MSSWRRVGVAAVLAGAVSHAGAADSVARADHCAETAGDWVVVRGTLGKTATCGAWVLASDSSAARYSYGEVQLSTPASLPYELSVTVRRLTSDGARPLEIRFQGGWLMLKDGAWGVYLSEPQFAADGWHAVDGLDTHREHTVVVTQGVDAVAIRLDGVDLGVWPVLATAVAGAPSIGFKGMSGFRARMRFRDVRLRSLAAPQGASARQ